MAWAASTAPPEAIAPEGASGAPNPGRGSWVSADGGLGAGGGGGGGGGGGERWGVGGDEPNGAVGARRAPGAGGHGDQAVGAFFDRLVRKPVVDDVVQHDAAPAVHGLVH